MLVSYKVTCCFVPASSLLLRFCCSNILGSGNSFFDLVLHASRYIYQNMTFVFERPDCVKQYGVKQRNTVTVIAKQP